MSVIRIRDAYGARAMEYTSLFGSIDAAAQQDRECVLGWARSVTGLIIDIGCGPGQWTNYLFEQGIDVRGVDPVPEFILEARRRYLDVTFQIGDAAHLEVEDSSLGGVLSWFSLIHTEPEQVGALLAEFARCTRPGGGLVIGFFEGPELVPFDHAVTTGYFWPVDQLSARVEQAGFQVTEAHVRTDSGARRQGTILARRCV